ncbi:hypothetical protein MHK_003867, partial [Candidatus Magnetomorum sp. HK-1]
LMNLASDRGMIESARDEGLEEGMEKGIEKGKIEMIENLLNEGVQWQIIEKVSGYDKDSFNRLKSNASKPPLHL